VQQKELIGQKTEKQPLVGMIQIPISGCFQEKIKFFIDMKL